MAAVCRVCLQWMKVSSVRAAHRARIVPRTHPPHALISTHADQTSRDHHATAPSHTTYNAINVGIVASGLCRGSLLLHGHRLDGNRLEMYYITVVLPQHVYTAWLFVSDYPPLNTPTHLFSVFLRGGRNYTILV